MKITIIGLGEQGISIGSALSSAKERFLRIGYDADINRQHAAQRAQAIDKSVLNIHQAVQDADIIALCESWDKLQPTLQTIASSVKQNSVIIDTSPMKCRVAEWVRAYFPPTVSYIGIYPVEHLTNASLSPNTETLSFNNLPIYLAAPGGTSSAALDLVTQLIQAMAAHPIYIDLLELDGILAKTQLLPPLLAQALIQTTINQGGWQDARKLSSLPFAFITSAMNTQTPEALVAAWSSNQENTLRVLDDLIAALTSLRQTLAELSENNPSQIQHLISASSQAQQAHQQWWSERLNENWQEGVPLPVLEKRSFLSRFSAALFQTKRKN